MVICAKIKFAVLILGNTYVNNEQVDTKSNQWFGATVASAGIDGPLVVSLYANKIINFMASSRCGGELFNFSTENGFNVNSCSTQFLQIDFCHLLVWYLSDIHFSWSSFTYIAEVGTLENIFEFKIL